MEFLNKIDKQQVQKITLIVIAALTILALVLLLVVIVASVNPANSFGISGGFDNMIEHTITDKDLQTGSLVLADDEHNYTVAEELLGIVSLSEYRAQMLIEENLEVSKANYQYLTYSNLGLSNIAIHQAHKMLVDAKNNVDQRAIYVDAGYHWRLPEGHDEIVEYQTGLLMHLADYDSEADKGNEIALSKEYRNWLRSNAEKYGFIESFEDSYRYVGVAHAKAISESKDFDSLAEYIAYLKEKTASDASKTVEIKVGDATYKVYYVACVAGDTIKVPAESEGEVTISGTNEGGVIVTVKVK